MSCVAKSPKTSAKLLAWHTSTCSFKQAKGKIFISTEKKHAIQYFMTVLHCKRERVVTYWLLLKWQTFCTILRTFQPVTGIGIS